MPRMYQPHKKMSEELKEVKSQLKEEKNITIFLFWVLLLSTSINGLLCYSIWCK